MIPLAPCPIVQYRVRSELVVPPQSPTPCSGPSSSRAIIAPENGPSRNSGSSESPNAHMRTPATQTPCTSMFLCGSGGVLHMHSNDNTCNDNGYALLPRCWAIITAPVVLPVFLDSVDVGGVSGPCSRRRGVWHDRHVPRYRQAPVSSTRATMSS